MELSVHELIEVFECDDSFTRSVVEQSLVSQGKQVLPDIIKHLYELAKKSGKVPDTLKELRIAWGKVLHEIGKEIDPSSEIYPAKYHDIFGWISWAERIVWKGFIKRFENEYWYDCHPIAVRYRRSEYKGQLLVLGKKILPELIEHLSDKISAYDLDLQVFWGMFFAEIEETVDPLKTGPAKYNDYNGWISWAKRMLAKKES